MSDELDLKPIEERLHGISPWPWWEDKGRIVDADGNVVGCAIFVPYEGCSGKNNAAFFGFAPELVNRLVIEIKRLRNNIDALEGELSDLADALDKEVYRR